MSYRLILYISLFSCIMFGAACTNKDKQEKEQSAKSIVSTTGDNQGREVADTSLASKGIIVSTHDVPVYSMVSEAIKQKIAKEGMVVQKGQVLFYLDMTMQESDIEKTQREIEQAKFQYDNILVGQGYDLSRPNAIPAKIKQIARTRSSLNLYEQEMQQKKLISEYYTIKAPISGVVINVQAYEHDLAEKGKELCHIVDTDNLQIKFSILENELSKFRKGATMHFNTIAYPNITYSATVTEVGSTVDENGMVKVKAAVNHDSNFKDLKVGMNAIVKK